MDEGREVSLTLFMFRVAEGKATSDECRFMAKMAFQENHVRDVVMKTFLEIMKKNQR